MIQSLFYNEIEQLMGLLMEITDQKQKKTLVLIDDLTLSTSTLNHQAMHKTMLQTLTSVKLLDKVQRSGGGPGLGRNGGVPWCFVTAAAGG